MIDDTEFGKLLATRSREPERVANAWEARGRRSLLAEDGRLFIVAADHPARGVLKAGTRSTAMADRRGLLERCATALAQPGVDGILAAPDVMEDLLLLGALEHRVAIGSMNRGGLADSAWELDDRFTGYDVRAIAERGLDGGKMLLRLDLADPRTIDTVSACSDAVSGLARAGRVAMVEPLPARRDESGRLRIAKEPDALIHAACVAAALGASSAYSWLKLPVVDEMERVAAATTLPVLLLGGDPGPRADEVFAGWRRALRLPTVRGLVAGRALLFPEDDDVEAAVRRAADLVHGGDG